MSPTKVPSGVQDAIIVVPIVTLVLVSLVVRRTRVLEVLSSLRGCVRRAMCASWISSKNTFQRTLSRFVDMSLSELLFFIILMTFPIVLRWVLYFIQFPTWSSGFQSSGVRAAVFRALGEVNFIFLGFILFPVSKNSVFVWLLGISFERAVRWHRFWGMAALTCMTLHGAGMWGSFIADGGEKIDPLLLDSTEATYLFASFTNREPFSFVLKFAKNPTTGWSNLSGLLCWICFVCAALAAMCRRFNYTWFYFSHVAFIIPGYVFAYLHMPALLRFTLAAAVLLGLDRLLRFFRVWEFSTRLTDVRVYGDEATTFITKLTFERFSKHFGTLPVGIGQFVYVGIPELSLTHVHPFSVAEIRDGGRSFSVFIKDMGKNTFTHQLRVWAQALSANNNSSVPMVVMDGSADLSPADPLVVVHAFPEPSPAKPAINKKIYLDGPYGCPSLDLTQYETLVLICGGIGVTPCLPLLTPSSFNTTPPSLLSAFLSLLSSGVYSQRLSPKKVVLHWTNPTPSILQAFEQTFRHATRQCPRDGSLQLRFIFHFTRMTNQEDRLLPVFAQEMMAAKDKDEPLSLQVSYSRPNYMETIREEANLVKASHVAVFACGPEAMVFDAQHAASTQGVDFHKEIFEF